MSYLDDSVAQIEVFEGRVRWLYLDTKGNVTCAVGLMLPNLAAALALPFQIMSGGVEVPATAGQILADFNRVADMQPGLKASAYECATSVFLADDEMDSLLRKVVAANDSLLSKFYKTYVAWPDAAKLAILDMCYNLGAQHLERTYPTMDGYLNLVPPNFIGASEQCARDANDPEFEARNEWTRKQFLEAA